MKDKKKNIILFICWLSMCAFQYFDTENQYGFLAFIPWIVGLYFLCKSFKPEIDKELYLLKNDGNTKDFISMFVSGSASVALLTVATVTGFTGKFRFNMALFDGIVSESFFSFLFTCACALFSFCVIMFAVLFVFLLAFTIAIHSNEHTKFGNTLALYTCFALVLSHLCGIIDVFKMILPIISIFE